MNEFIKLKDLPDGGHITFDCDEIKETMKHCSVSHAGVSGLLVFLDDSGTEYKEMYATESIFPYLLKAEYYRVF